MKNKKQILCVLLAVVLTISTFAPMSVFAFVGVDEIEVELLQEGSFDPIVSTSSLAVSAISGDTSSVEAEIYNQLLNCATSFNLTLYKVSIDDFYLLYCDVVNNNPDLFYVSSNVQYNYYQTSKTVSTVKPQYAMTSSEIADAKVIFNEGVSKALSVVDDSMSDLQKALVLHDYICDLAEYPDISTEDKNIYHSAYGFFYDQKVVCAGYTLAYSYLLSMVGIECEQVSSTAMVHAWNAVNIDGNWYNVDLTFDDIGFYNSNMNVRGGMMHYCFMKSDDGLDALGFYHYGGATSHSLEMTDTTYDDYFWNDIDTNIYVLDGDYYYLNVEKDARKETLVKRTVDGDETQIGSTSFYHSGVTATMTNYDEDGNANKVSVYDPLCRLVYLDNRFYLTQRKTITSYAYMDGKYTSYQIYADSSNNLIGLGVDDDGNLVCQTQKTYQSYTLDKNEYFSNNISRKVSSPYNNYVDINLDGYVNAKDFKIINS